MLLTVKAASRSDKSLKPRSKESKFSHAFGGKSSDVMHVIFRGRATVSSIGHIKRERERERERENEKERERIKTERRSIKGGEKKVASALDKTRYCTTAGGWHNTHAVYIIPSNTADE